MYNSSYDVVKALKADGYKETKESDTFRVLRKRCGRAFLTARVPHHWSYNSLYLSITGVRDSETVPYGDQKALKAAEAKLDAAYRENSTRKAPDYSDFEWDNQSGKPAYDRWREALTTFVINYLDNHYQVWRRNQDLYHHNNKVELETRTIYLTETVLDNSTIKPDFYPKSKVQQAVRSTLYALKKKGEIERVGRGWVKFP